MSEVLENHIVIKLHRPSIYEKLFFLTSGIIISVPFTFFLETLADQYFLYIPKFYFTIFTVAILAPLIEEFAKAYPLFFRHGETERSILILGLLVGLGFGLSEFFVYIFVYGAPIYSRISGIIFHASNTSIVAYGVAKRRILLFYFISVFFHSIINLSILIGNFYLVIGFICTLLSYFLLFYFFARTKENFCRDSSCLPN